MGKLNRLGHVLTEAGVITPEILETALAHQVATGEATGHWPRLGSVLVGMGVVDEVDIARALSAQLGVPFVDLTLAEGDADLIAAIPRRLAERHCLAPVKATGHGVMLAMADPTDIVAIDDLRAAAHLGQISIGVAPAAAIREAINRFYTSDMDAADLLKRLGVAADASVEPEGGVAVHFDAAEVERAARTGPVVQLANAILADAVSARATDVHVEPQRDEVKVRYRVDGLLREVMTLPKSVHASLVSRLKIASGMDISERRRPQDGRGRLSVDGLEVALRLSTVPTLQGEKVVIRLLRQGDNIATLEDLGFEPEDLRTIHQALNSPQGFLLFTGPTGSGKTTTMYAGIGSRANPQLNIVTLEDPIEYQIPEINQTQIDEKSGLSFAKVLRGMLRQDPNIIMVGEVRDAETAAISLQAAMTGHLVMSTVHTADAPSAIARLVDLGVEPFLIAGALSVVVAQRLVRVICSHCKTETPPNESTMDRLGIGIESLQGATIFRGTGCPACGFTGYLGRTGVFQVMTITRQIRDQISADLSESALTQVARASGVKTLLEAGLRKVRAGVTTLEEVLRAVQSEEIDKTPTCPACRHEIDPSFVVCPHCQYALAGPRCPSCARDVKPDWAACPYCRTELQRWKAPSGKQRRVLVADDDPHARELVSMMLSDDFEVVEAEGGEEAMRHAVLHRPDVILMDLHMPDIDGIELAKRLRASAATSLIPLIMLTADDSGEVEGLRAGVDDYIVKPFEETKLRARIDRAIAAR